MSYELFTVRKHPHKPCSLDCFLEHLLMAQADTCVVARPNIPKVIEIRLDRRIVFPVNVLHTLFGERTLFLAGISAALLLRMWHVRVGNEWNGIKVI